MQHLTDATTEKGTLTREQLLSFPVADSVWKLLDHSRGIRNPRELAATLTVMSSPTGPYRDEDLQGGLLKYEYRAGSVNGDNTKLRRAYELGMPLILLKKIEPSVYVPIHPVYVVADVQDARYFLLALDEGIRLLSDPLNPSEDERRYVERITRERLHQPEFRGRVLRAYETRCAVCVLRHGRLLDAAHIVADHEVTGTPITANGLALCKLHHAAYDSDLLGISPDYQVHINSALLEETDGPMLRHGLQEMDGRELHVPHRASEKPDRDRLGYRFQKFLASA
ncbi:HNH endonuclease [Aeromicrobium sp. IC_218]|uniref:HNH endonuclease n=1 Tax=Aeromicrobium sp. IC_218 TaxID=2545468 RepID=UPI001A955C99|nr:HNH endonuclease [Aeromicrobium sp. IC_218]